ncbi:Transcriptional activator NphR [Pseudomonas fluorescens]|uniref:Transcriptional activator NphR n=1 Tax=Pseudomonas fluorescens TaxID=294 RepID=A0A5E7QJA6_PSEFL|nr:helix-turn-helix domain-containing protein [Pseudomonas fluorescens]VVP61558.1 Transcriptional activator NphR [Pseudomonas fluorescens]
MTTVEVVFSSRAVESSLRSDYWREMMQPVFDIGVPGENRNRVIEGEFCSRSNGELLIGRTTFSAQSFVRSRRKVQTAGLDGYVLQLFVVGSMRGNAGECTVHVRPGDLYILDLGRVCESQSSAGARLTMMIERRRLEQLVGRADLHGIIFRREQPINRLLTDFLTELWNVSLGLSYADSMAAVDVVSRLFKGGLGDCTPLLSQEWDIALTTVRSNTLRYIDAHLTQPELSVEFILRRFGVSRAALYRAFELDGGVARVIREKRLNAARALLSHATGQSIAQVAYTYGFTNQSQFFKAFRRQFGMAPSDAIGTEPSRNTASTIGRLAFPFSATAHPES